MLKKIIKGLGIFIISVVGLVVVFFSVMVFMPNFPKGEYVVEKYTVAKETQEKIILDCDNSMGTFWEVDDGLVLSYLINKPEADLLGVTTTFGNRTYQHEYTKKMLAQLDRQDIPLYKGEQTPEEGITEAAIFLAETVAKYPGEVSIVAAGPVGNLAAAYEYDPDFFSNVKQITVMGGYTQDLSLGSRDIDELNLSADYLATYEMIKSGAKVTIMTGQACLDAPFYFSDISKLEKYPYNWKFFITFWTCLQKIGLGNNYFVVWDMLPTSYVFHPEFFEDNFVYLNSSTDDLADGMLKISEDKEGYLVNIPDGIYDKDGFFTDMLQILNMK